MTDAAKLDRHWHILRISSDELPGKHLLADASSGQHASRKRPPMTIRSRPLWQCTLRLKGNDRPPTFAGRCEALLRLPD